MSLWSMALFCTLSLLPDMKDGQIIFQKSQITANGTVWGRETWLCACPAHGTGRERGGPRPLGSSEILFLRGNATFLGNRIPNHPAPNIDDIHDQKWIVPYVFEFFVHSNAPSLITICVQLPWNTPFTTNGEISALTFEGHICLRVSDTEVLR